VWGATSGLAVAAGPIAGGWLLEHSWWGSVFFVNVPIVIAGIVAVALVVPESRDLQAPRLDVPGLVLSIAAITTLVFTVIEAPKWGWASPETITGFAASALLIAVFVTWELRVAHPMMPVRIVRDLRFSAASVSITAAFFALFGFIS
jgi:MFS family permease